MLFDQVPQQFSQRLASLLLRQYPGNVTGNRTCSPGTDFPVDPRDLILGQTDRDLRLGHTNIIPRGACLKIPYQRTGVVKCSSLAFKDANRSGFGEASKHLADDPQLDQGLTCFTAFRYQTPAGVPKGSVSRQPGNAVFGQRQSRQARMASWCSLPKRSQANGSASSYEPPTGPRQMTAPVYRSPESSLGLDAEPRASDFR